jgi:uncharacterized protein
MEISKQQARTFLLVYQGLWSNDRYTGKLGIMDYIRKVGCIQYDPLNIVGHNPELVLQARVADFHPGLLRELLYHDRLLLDGFDKLMSIYPVEDWPYFRRWREAARHDSGDSAEMIHSVVDHVREQIKARGPLSSLDLNLPEIVNWDWAQSRLARAALESMYFWGELVVHHRVHTRKYYDFTYRHLPGEILQAPEPNPSEESYQDWHVHRRIGSVGLLWDRSGEAWYIHSIKSKQRKAALKRLLDQEKVVQIQVSGIKDPFYFRSQDLPILEDVLAIEPSPPKARIMAPLDNLLWDRRLLRQIFDFKYTWEVYVPASKRRYGYYVLPILYGDCFIARFDPGFDKKTAVLTIKNWWWEDEVELTDLMKADLIDCFNRFMKYLAAAELQIDQQVSKDTGLDWLLHQF